MGANENLGFYDPNHQTTVIADASPVGLGAVLVQEDHNSVPRVIYYASKSLSATERNYSQMEKEALGLVWAVERFRFYLYGKEFFIITDHKTLETIFSPRSKPCARIERWVLRLQSFKYKVLYKPGKSNVADPLSRLLKTSNHPHDFDAQIEQYVLWVAQESTPKAVQIQDIEKSSMQDPVFMRIKRSLNDGIWTDNLKSFRLIEMELCFVNNILLRGTKIVIPDELRSKILEAAHEGHPGICKMKARLRSKVWWPGIDKDAESFVRGCKGCLIMAPFPKPEPMIRRMLPTHPWKDVALDFLGPFPDGKYILVVIDYFSRYVEMKILSKITAIETIRSLRSIFARFGNPKSITTDGGTQLQGLEFTRFCQHNDINHITSPPMWPQFNGEVERQNRSILKVIKISHSEGRDWKDDIEDYLLMYRSTPHTVTGVAPSKLMFGWTIRDKLPQFDSMNTENPEWMEVRERDSYAKDTGKLYADKKRKAVVKTFIEGDKVLVKNFNRNNKFAPNFDPQPYEVVSKHGAEVTVKNMATNKRYKRNSAHLLPLHHNKVLGEDEGERNENHTLEDTNDGTEIIVVDGSNKCTDESPTNASMNLEPMVDDQEMTSPDQCDFSSTTPDQESNVQTAEILPMEDTNNERRSKRNRQPTKKFDDYILYNLGDTK